MPRWTDNGDYTPVGNPLDRDVTGAINMVTAGSLLVFLRRDIGLRLLMRRRFVVMERCLWALPTSRRLLTGRSHYLPPPSWCWYSFITGGT